MGAKALLVLVIIAAVLFAAMIGFGRIKSEGDDPDPTSGNWAEAAKALFRETDLGASDLADAPRPNCSRSGLRIIIPRGEFCRVRIVSSRAGVRSMKLVLESGDELRIGFEPHPDEDPPVKFSTTVQARQGRSPELRVYSKGGVLDLTCEMATAAAGCTLRIDEAADG